MKTVLGPSAANPDAAGDGNLEPGSETYPIMASFPWVAELHRADHGVDPELATRSTFRCEMLSRSVLDERSLTPVAVWEHPSRLRFMLNLVK
jgi:hypothetical protein